MNRELQVDNISAMESLAPPLPGVDGKGKPSTSEEGTVPISTTRGFLALVGGTNTIRLGIAV